MYITLLSVLFLVLQEDGVGSEGSEQQSLLDLLEVKHVLAVLYSDANAISWSPATSSAQGEFRSANIFRHIISISLKHF